jgi:hypothetical protein
MQKVFTEKAFTGKGVAFSLAKQIIILQLENSSLTSIIDTSLAVSVPLIKLQRNNRKASNSNNW